MVQSAYTAILWDLAPRVTAGLELLHGRSEIESGDGGELTRLRFSIQCAF